MATPAGAAKVATNAAKTATAATYQAVTSSTNTTRYTIIILAIVLFMIFCVVVLGYLLQRAAKKPRVEDENVKKAMAKRVLELENMQMGGSSSLYASLDSVGSGMHLPENQEWLINLCPLTASVGGYLGPLRDGVFDISRFIQMAFDGGIRSFVLPISTYYDDNKYKKNWPVSGSPAVVYRDINGKVLSLNAIRIKDFCEKLLEMKGRNSGQNEEPILIFLHGVEGYIPDVTTQEETYVKFMSQIAEGVAPLEKYMLKTFETYGSLRGGSNQDKIMKDIPLKQLKGKIIVFTNFDTRVFQKTKYRKISPSLSDYINYIYSPFSSANTDTCSSISIKDINAGFMRDKVGKWFITLNDHIGTIPSASDVDKAIGLGAQCIPVPFIAGFTPLAKDEDSAQDLEDNSDLTKIYKQWRGYAWRLRQDRGTDSFADMGSRDMLYTKQPPVVPKQPSERLNARVTPTSAPGEIVVT
jgi:hypothetical protein